MAFNRLSTEDLCAELVKICEYYLGGTVSRSWGRNLYYTCPRCGKPKFTVSTDPDKPVFNCFVCGFRGNALSLIQEIENCTSSEAIKKAKEILGLPNTNTHPPKLYTKSTVTSDMERYFQDVKRSVYLEIYRFYLAENRQATDYWRGNLIQPPPPLDYMDMVSSRPSLDLVGHLLKFYPVEVLSDCPGFITRDETLVFTLNNHILFPYWDENGENILTFNGKVKRPKEGEPRYKGLIGEGKHLYIPFGVRVSTPSEDSVDKPFLVLTEGEKKAIVASASGFPAVAVAGVDCFDTPELQDVDLASRTIFICYDNEKPNPNVRAAEKRLADYLRDRNASVVITSLPQGYKLDDFIHQRGSPAFRFFLNASTWRSGDAS